MELPADQKLLYHDLCEKLEAKTDTDTLIRFVGQVLRSLLRRQGDREFLVAVQDAFTSGLSGLNHEDQVNLAREVIGLVIAKRPEIALAWQKVNQITSPYQRRASDAEQPELPEHLRELPDFSISEDPEDHQFREGYAAAQWEEAVALLVGELLKVRLAHFHLPPPQKFPSASYSHEQGFVLFNPAFVGVMTKFISQVVLPATRMRFESEIYSQAPNADREQILTVLAQSQEQIWKILSDYLIDLDHAHSQAEQKLEAAKNSAHLPEFKTVEVPVSRPRVLRVLGVGFTLGTTTQIKRKKIRMKPNTELTASELQSLDLAATLHDLGGRAGLDLPHAIDFGTLSLLLNMDSVDFGERLNAILDVARNPDIPRDDLFGALTEAQLRHPLVLTDVMAIALFLHASDASFGFQELYDLAVNTSPPYPGPFLSGEINRRPRDLAFQIREALKRRIDRNHFGIAVVMLFEVWRALDREKYKTAMDAALTVFSAFPVAFAGDPDEQILVQIGATLHKYLSVHPLDAASCIDQVTTLYAPVAAKAKAQASA